jgi:uncharacterized protein (TIGR01777 family)
MQMLRGPAQTSAQAIHWNPATMPCVQPEEWARLEGAHAMIHLSGENLAAGRWTPARKRRFAQSRIDSTRNLSALLAQLQNPPPVLLCASAVGFYGDRGDAVLTEDAQAGTGFLPELCVAWEQASDAARARGIRVVHLRLGVVLTPEGGALSRMLPLFRLGLGGRLGDGRQWMSWIALADAVRAILHLLRTPNLAGPVHLVAPNPVTNAEFTRTLAQQLHRPALLHAPAFALRALLGEMTDAMLLASTRAVPSRLLRDGFVFEHATLEAALDAALHASHAPLLG